VDLRPPIQLPEPYPEPYGEVDEEPLDLVLAGQNLIPQLLHGMPTLQLDDHYNNIAYFQFTTQHYSEEDLLSDIKTTIRGKHRKQHHPLIRKVIGESLKHVPELHNLYFN